MAVLLPNGLYPPEIELVVEQVRKLINRCERAGKKLSFAHLAAGIGKSASTVSNFLNHKDSGNVDDTAARLKAYVERELARLDGGLPSIPFCETRQARKMMDAVAFAHRYRRMVAVIAPSGLGKSRTIEELRRRDPSILAIRASVIHGASGILKDLCDELQLPDTGLLRALYKRIKARLAGSSRCLIVDDAHDLSLHSLHFLRTLFDDLDIGVVLVGITTLRRWLTGTNDELEQLASRVSGRIWELPEFTEQDVRLLLEAVMAKPDVDAALSLFKQDPRTLVSARRVAYALETAGRASEKQYGKGSKVHLVHFKAALEKAAVA